MHWCHLVIKSNFSSIILDYIPEFHYRKISMSERSVSPVTCRGIFKKVYLIENYNKKSELLVRLAKLENIHHCLKPVYYLLS